MRTLYVFLLVLFCQNIEAQRLCGTQDYLQSLKQNTASLFLSQSPVFSQSVNSGSTAAELSSQTVINIPVVVHVVYSDASGNISDAQIQSQIDALNKNFNRENEDFSKVPAVFAKLAGAANIRFTLARVDPNGKATNGITRTRSSRLMWSNDDKIKSAAYGGVTPWDSRSYLNIWVGNLIPGLLGYASAPGAAPEVDGVVIRWNVFGTIGVSGSFNLGRTAVHEVGHWLNLKHLWGDKECGSDEVDDTPQQRTYNQGVPSFPRIGTGCSAANPYGDMFMNFMDFTNDAAMMMFTQGQVTRMRSLFNGGGARSSLLASKALGQPYSTAPSLPANPTTPGVNQPQAASLAIVKIYPNPATDRITLTSTGEQGISGNTYTLYTSDGKVVSTGIINGNVFNMNVSTLRRGLYFLRVGDQMIRFVKQ